MRSLFLARLQVTHHAGVFRGGVLWGRGSNSRVSMAKTVRLWIKLASRSRGLAELMTPLSASTLKKRSKSVFLSMEYLDNDTQRTYSTFISVVPSSNRTDIFHKVLSVSTLLIHNGSRNLDRRCTNVTKPFYKLIKLRPLCSARSSQQGAFLDKITTSISPHPKGIIAMQFDSCG